MTITLLFCPESKIKEKMLQYLSSQQEISDKCECGNYIFYDGSDTGNLVCLQCGLEKSGMSMETSFRDNATMTTTRTPFYRKRQTF